MCLTRTGQAHCRERSPEGLGGPEAAEPLKELCRRAHSDSSHVQERF